MWPALHQFAGLGWQKKAQHLLLSHGQRRKHTGRKRKLGIADGVINILQCNVTNWSGHARNFIPTSDFDAALISQTHLEKAKITAGVKEARKSAWAGTGSAGISTANNGTSATVLTLVRNRGHSKPLSICADEAGVQPTVGREGHSSHGHGSSSGHSLFGAFGGTSQRNESQFDARCVFSHERRKILIHFGDGLLFTVKLVAGLVSSRRQSFSITFGRQRPSGL